MKLVFGPEELEEARHLIERALAEDMPRGDLTTEGLFGRSGGPWIRAEIATRARGVVCGLPVAAELFRSAAPAVVFERQLPDGESFEPGAVLAILRGPAGSILSLERIALNFIQRLSGIATQTRAWVDAIAAAQVEGGHSTKVLETRKTTPGWRRLEKYAVRAGGAENHRMGLSDAILVKDNHAAILRAMGRTSMAEWVSTLRRAHPGVFLEVEVDGRKDFIEALDAGVDAILLDNFPLEEIRWAVARRDEGRSGAPGGRQRGPLLEASGGLKLAMAGEVASTRVDRISVGALTHSAPALDVGLDLVGLEEVP
jgi:nicotinate-nucleotide pyrophosphorylase (carboxylating)